VPPYRGVEPPYQGVSRGARAPLHRRLGETPPKNIFLSVFMSVFGRFLGTWFFVDDSLFPVKELGLLTNSGYWIRVLDVAGSYMYIVL